MIYFFVFALIIALSYVALIVVFCVGWKCLPEFTLDDKQSNMQFPFNITVIVPCKNEEDNLHQLIDSLHRQTFADVELIFVDDHSTDNTYEILSASLWKFSNGKIIQSSGTGKKDALRTAVLQASGDFIITTDADCNPVQTWIETLACFQFKQHCDLIICPVRQSFGNSIFSDMQAFEFVSLIATGAGAAGIGSPILCNGANLAFTKQAWIQSQNDLHNEQLSGDDIFLLQSIKKRNGNIRFLKSVSSFVSTKPVNSFINFIKQRKRWTSKASAYSDPFLILTACLVFGISLIQVLLLIISIFNCHYFPLFLILFLLKYCVDTVLFFIVKSFFGLKNVVFYTFLCSALYPFYISATALSAFLIKQRKWM